MEEQHRIQPGDWVYIKVFKRKNALKARWTGPHQLLLVTNTAVKCKGKPIMDSRISLQKSIQEVVKRIEETRKWEERYRGFMTYVAVLLMSMCIIVII